MQAHRMHRAAPTTCSRSSWPVVGQPAFRRRGAAPRMASDAASQPEAAAPDDAADRIPFQPTALPESPVTAPPGARPIIILPGFGNNTADYTAPFGIEEMGLATRLQERGWHVGVVQLERKDWFKVARSLLRPIAFSQCKLTTDPGYTWYLDRVAAAVEAAREGTGCNQVDLVAHSAGGWLGRAFLGDPKYCGQAAAGGAPNASVASLLTLGTPHQPPAPGSGARDMTGGALTWVNGTYPGAHWTGAGVRYVCVAGRAVRGRRRAPNQKQRTLASYAHDSYQTVCGQGEGVEGDAVVPLAAAHLEGAANLTLDGVMHSMSRIGTFEERAPDALRWYGDVVDCWLPALVGSAGGGSAQVPSPAEAASSGAAA